MFIDQDLVFSDDQAITATGRSTEIVNLGTRTKWGISDIVTVKIQVTKAFTNAGSLVAQIRRWKEPDGTDSAGSNQNLSFSNANLGTAGFEQSFDIPADWDVASLDINYVVTGTIASGTITAWIDTKKLGYVAVEAGAAIA